MANVLEMFKKFKLYFNTIKYLKLSQIFWQVFYRAKSRSYLVEKNVHLLVEFQKFEFVPSQEIKYKGNNTFCFLNLEYQFDCIDWNFPKYGKLWNYNLEYFDYLFQENISTEEKMRLLNSFYEYCKTNKKPLEPYPVSLRIINTLKFFSVNQIQDYGILNYIHQELFFLNKNLEFQILGNHLLENAFALCLGGAFFKNRIWHDRAIKILQKELNEQTLKDGAHFELSPMYHNIILYRVLELTDWYSTYNCQNQKFLSFCRDIASRMYTWSKKIQFNNGDIPLFNDAAKGIAFDTHILANYAASIDIRVANISLGESGYRGFINNNYEIKIDLAQIGSRYQPGHAHADALSFILYRFDKPLFVEQGTSTYENGRRRDLERSTESHNTVVVAGRNQSAVWGGFRVGKRAKTTILKDGENSLIALHDGYKELGTIHERKFEFGESEILLEDSLCTNRNEAKAYLHLYPGYIPQIEEGVVIISDDVYCCFDGATSISIEVYQYADTYNMYKEAHRLVVSFNKKLRTIIKFQKD